MIFHVENKKTDNVRLYHFMTALTLFSDDTGKRIAQYDNYYNQYNLSRNQIKHVEQMHLVTEIKSILISSHFNIILCSVLRFFSLFSVPRDRIRLLRTIMCSTLAINMQN